MKMFKRLLALVIVFSMIAVLPMFAQAEEVKTVNNEVYDSLVDKLSAVGIWSLEKNATDTITRQEFASLMAKLLNADGSGATEINFVDVDKNSIYYDDISYLKSFGIMSGVDSDRFAPLRTITYEEALKTLLRALGYGDRAEIKGGFPAGYISVGLSLGFKTSTGELTAFDAVRMLDQAAFKVRLMSIIGYSDKGAIIGANGDTTVINAYHGIYKAKGKLTDNGLTELYNITAINPDDSMVKIDNEAYMYDGGENIRRALNSTLEYYYKEENGIKTLLWWDYAYQSREVIVVYAEDIVKNSPKFSKTNFVYKTDDNKTKSVAIAPRAAFIFNEIAFPTFTVADLKPMEGWFTLVDENGDNEVDIIFAEVYENYFVISESNNGEVFADRFYRSVDTAKFDKVEVFNAQGLDIFNPESNKINKKSAYEANRQAGAPAQAVKANSVISVFKSKTNENGEGAYLRIILSEVTVTENLNAVVIDDDETIYTVGKSDYIMNDYISSQIGVDNSLPELRIGEKYRFYLDYRGEITYYEAMSAVNQYAYLLASGKESGTGILAKGALFKLVLESGQIATLPLAEEVIYNGAKTAEIDVLNSADIQKGKQLIRMKLNNKGEIREVNTAYTLCNTPLYKGVGYDPSKFNMVVEYSGTKPMGNNRFMFTSTSYAYDTQTIFFHIPSSGREEDIKVYKGTSGADKLKGSYKLKGYDADNVLTMNAVTLEDMVDTAAYDYGAYGSFVYIVTEVKGTQNIYGEDVKQVRAWCYDYEYNLIEDAPGILPADVKPGDILRIQKNSDEKIVKADKVLSTMDNNGNPLNEEDRALPFGYSRTDKTKTKLSSWGEAVLYGYPVGRNASGITLAIGEPIGTKVYFIPFYTPGIVYFDVENLDCSTADRTAIPVMATLDEVNNRFNINNKDIAVLVTTASSGMYDCIIIQY